MSTLNGCGHSGGFRLPASLARCWTAYYCIVRNWQPWPPIVLIIAMLDLMIGVRIFAIRNRVKRTGPYLHSQRSMDMMRAAAGDRMRHSG